MAQTLTTRSLRILTDIASELEADIGEVKAVRAAIQGGAVDHVVIVHGDDQELRMPAVWFCKHPVDRWSWWRQNKNRLMATRR